MNIVKTLGEFLNKSKTINLNDNDKNSWIPFLILAVLFLLMRIIAWKNTTILEDNDSIYYLLDMKNFIKDGISHFNNLNVDATPFYPMLGAILTLLNIAPETAARLASLLLSFLLFISIIGIGRKLSSSIPIYFALLILSLNSVYIFHSFAILSEPSYIATVYIGFWVLWNQFDNPTPIKGMILGLIFGLCFLNRTEGVLLILLIPAFQFVHFLFYKQRNYNFKKYLSWVFFFVFIFSLINAPQVMRVSKKLGFFAINGRQLWVLLFNNPDGKSPEQKIWGVDFSPSEVNIKYVQNHPEKLKDLESSVGILDYIKTIKYNMYDLFRYQLRILVGIPGFLFFCLGLLYLLLNRHIFEFLLILIFIAAGLIGPLIHSMDIRHIIILGPIMILMEGLGIVYLSKLIIAAFGSKSRFLFTEKSLSILFLMIIIVLSLKSTWASLHPLDYNFEHGVSELKKPILLVKQELSSDDYVPKFVARSAHLPYYTNGICYYIPYCDYDSLVEYCLLNDIDYLYFLDRRMKDHPYYQRFREGQTPDFQLYHTGEDAFGWPVRLYKFNKD